MSVRIIFILPRQSKATPQIEPTLHCRNYLRQRVWSLKMTKSVLTFHAVLTWSRKAFHLHAEVVLEEEEANNREEIDKEDGQNGCQNNRAAIPRHALYHVEQRLLSDHQVEQLWW